MNTSIPSARPRGRFKLLLVLLACAAPVIASYITYYVIRPEGRVNYADLIEPQQPMLDLAFIGQDGAPAGSLAELRGKWLMVVIAAPACDEACGRALYNIRQVRLTTGRERDRVERLWLLNAQGDAPPAILSQHEGLIVRRVAPEALKSRFTPAEGAAPEHHIYIIDPLGNLMMRFPANPDPSRMKKDLNKLLRASRVG